MTVEQKLAAFIDPTTGIYTEVGDSANKALRVSIVAGGGTGGGPADVAPTTAADETDAGRQKVTAVLRLLDTAQPVNAQLVAARGDQVDGIWVNVKQGGGGGIQYATGAPKGTSTGTLAMGSDGTNIRALTCDAAGILEVRADAGINTRTDLLNLETTQLAIFSQVGNIDTPLSSRAKESGGHLAALDANAGVTTDAAVTTDVSGTLSAKLRGLIKILSDVWDSTNHQLGVAVTNIITVTGTVTTIAGAWGTDLSSIAGVSGVASDTADVGDNPGTLSAKLRGLTKIFGDVWDGANHWLQVKVTNAVTIGAGSAVIGHVVVDSGTVTANIGSTGGVALEAGNLATLAAKDFATSANQATGNASLSSIDGKLSRPSTSTESEIFPAPGNNTLLAINVSRKGARLRNSTNLPLYLKEGAVADDHSYTELVAPGASYDVEAPTYTGQIDGYFLGVPFGSVYVTERI